MQLYASGQPPHTDHVVLPACHESAGCQMHNAAPDRIQMRFESDSAIEIAAFGIGVFTAPDPAKYRVVSSYIQRVVLKKCLGIGIDLLRQ